VGLSNAAYSSVSALKIRPFKNNPALLYTTLITGRNSVSKQAFLRSFVTAVFDQADHRNKSPNQF